MGRRKIEIRKLEGKAERSVTYCKRSKGLLKKAYELSVLCGVDVGLIMYSPKGVLRHFSTAAPNAAKVLEGMIQHLHEMSYDDREKYQLPQHLIDMVSITAGQIDDDAADLPLPLPGPDAAIREEIKRKNRELRLLLGTKRMVYPSMETLQSLPSSEELERFLETRLNEILELKRQFLVQHRQGVQMQEQGMSEQVQLPMQQPQGGAEARNLIALLGGVQKQEQGIPLEGMSEQMRLVMQQQPARNPINQQMQQQGVPALEAAYPSSPPLQAQLEAGRNWDAPHGGGQRLQHQQSVSASGMGYSSASSSGEDASNETDVEMEEATQHAWFNSQGNR